MLSLPPTLRALALAFLLPQGGWREGSLEEALAAAHAAGAPLAVCLENPEDAGCRRFWSETLEHAAVRAELERWVCLRVSAASPAGARLVGRYHVSQLPTVLVLGEDGAPEDALVGAWTATPFAERLRALHEGRGTLSALRRAAEAAPQDLGARYALAKKLAELGLATESQAAFAAIREQDPDGKTAAGARVKLADLMQALMDSGSSSSSGSAMDMGGHDLQPMYAFLKRTKVAEVELEGWTWLAGAEAAFGDAHRAFDALAKGRAFVAAGGWRAWSARVLPLYWERRAELGAGDRRAALEIAEAARAEGEAALAQLGEEAQPALAAALEAAARFRWLAGKKEDARTAARRALELAPTDAAVKATAEWLERGK